MSDKTQPGSTFAGRFIIKRRLGRGGSATVWLATDSVEDREVALKLLHRRYRQTESALERLRRELGTLLKLEHPHIARAHDLGIDGEHPFIVMEFVKGRTLADSLAERSGQDDHFTAAEILDVATQMCTAVEFAHSQGILHRDLKPQNIMLSGVPPHVKLLDFGIAKAANRPAGVETTQGRIVGSIPYMSPEQATGEGVSERSDVFGLGVTLLEMITLRRAWVRDDDGGPLAAYSRPVPSNSFNSLTGVLERIASASIVRISELRPDLPRGLDTVFERALAPDRAARLGSPQALLSALTVALGDVGEAGASAWTSKTDAGYANMKTLVRRDRSEPPLEPTPVRPVTHVGPADDDTRPVPGPEVDPTRQVLPPTPAPSAPGESGVSQPELQAPTGPRVVAVPVWMLVGAAVALVLAVVTSGVTLYVLLDKGQGTRAQPTAPTPPLVTPAPGAKPRRGA